jgi:adenylylsulfate kinase
LEFSDEGRLENIRRASEVAKVLVEAGVTVIASFLSPLKIHRDLARSKLKNKNFFEIYCSASLEVCERRDPKGHYVAARKGEIKNFTGVDAPYEKPQGPDLIVDTEETTIECGVQSVLSLVNVCNLTTKQLNKPP